MKQQIDNNHRVYGYWDDCGDYQFMVVTNSENKSIDVYLMDGYDYGGGISRIYRIEEPAIAGLESILERHNTIDGYTLRLQVGVYCPAHGTLLNFKPGYSKEHQ